MHISQTHTHTNIRNPALLKKGCAVHIDSSLSEHIFHIMLSLLTCIIFGSKNTKVTSPESEVRYQFKNFTKINSNINVWPNFGIVTSCDASHQVNKSGYHWCSSSDHFYRSTYNATLTHMNALSFHERKSYILQHTSDLNTSIQSPVTITYLLPSGNHAKMSTAVISSQHAHCILIHNNTCKQVLITALISCTFN